MKESSRQFNAEPAKEYKTVEGKEMECQPTKKILLVEDKPEYQKAAIEALETAGIGGKLVVEVAKDYDEAMELIGKGEKDPKEKFDCVVTDLLFPKKTGSDDRTIGIEVMDKIREALKSPEARKDEEYRSMESHGIITRDLGELEKAVKGEEFKPGERGRMREEAERRGQLKQGDKISSTEADQPLGVLIVEKAKEIGLPYIVVTSGHGAHGDITTPIAYYLKFQSLIPSERGDSQPSPREKGNLILLAEEEYIQQMQEYYKNRGGEPPPKERLASDYREFREDWRAQPFFTDIDKNDPEMWAYVLQRATLYAEQERKEDDNKI